MGSNRGNRAGGLRRRGGSPTSRARVASSTSERIVKPVARRAARRVLLHPARHPRANRRPATRSSDLWLAERTAGADLDRLAFTPAAHPVRWNAGRSDRRTEGSGGTVGVPSSQRRGSQPSDRTL